MVCRVRARLACPGRAKEAVALLNSGFESDEPDIVVPVDVARELGLWPPSGCDTAVLDTGGGEVSSPYYRGCAGFILPLDDREPKKVR